MMKATLSLFAALIVSVSFATSLHAKTLRTVALTGTQAPGTPAGALFGDFSNVTGPAISNAGQVAIRSELRTGGGGVTTTNRFGVWSEGTGSLGLVARTGDAAPGTPVGAVFFDMSHPHINSLGQTVFAGALASGSGGVNTNNNSGIWFENAGSLNLVAREGSQAPGAPGGANFAKIDSLNSIVFNDTGKLAFEGALQTGSGGVTASNDSGIWSDYNGGGLSLVARKGSQASDAPVGANFGLGSPVLNNSDQIGFNGTLVTGSGGVTSSNNAAAWAERSGQIEMIIRKGDQAPGAPVGANFDSIGGLGYNDSSSIAFMGGMVQGVAGVTVNNNRGIWKDSSGSLALVAREGSQAPGTPVGANFGEFLFGPVMNGLGQTAFLDRLQTGSGGVSTSNDSGIWSEGSGTLELVAREGDHPVGTPANYFYADLYSEEFSPVLNGSGQVAFMAEYWPGAIGVPGSESQGIWAADDGGNLELIVRRGQRMRVGPNDLRVVNLLAFQGKSGNQDGRQSGFNDLGQLSFFARFTDGSEGIFVTQGPVTIPEPATCVLGMILGIAISLRRKLS